MMGFTKDGQVNRAMLAQRDKRFNISTQDKKKSRTNIPIPNIDGMANAWEKGEIRQFTISNNADSAMHKQ